MSKTLSLAGLGLLAGCLMLAAPAESKAQVVVYGSYGSSGYRSYDRGYGYGGSGYAPRSYGGSGYGDYRPGYSGYAPRYYGSSGYYGGSGYGGSGYGHRDHGHHHHHHHGHR